MELHFTNSAQLLYMSKYKCNTDSFESVLRVDSGDCTIFILCSTQKALNFYDLNILCCLRFEKTDFEATCIQYSNIMKVHIHISLQILAAWTQWDCMLY